MFIILVGTSSVGKTYLLDKLAMYLPMEKEMLIRMTTREQRPNDIGEYTYITKEHISNLFNRGLLFEYAEHHGNSYACLLSDVNKRAERDSVCHLLIAGLEGAVKFKNHYPDQTLIIGIKPDDEEMWKERVVGTRADSIERLGEFDTREKYWYLHTDYVVPSKEGDLQHLYSIVYNIIVSEYKRYIGV